MPDNPPPLGIGSGHLRTLGFHQYQVFDIMRGSGTSIWEEASSGEPIIDGSGIHVQDCVGEGPLYDLWMYRKGDYSGSGIDEIQVGDHLMCAYDDDDGYVLEIVGWYRYEIEEILTSGTAVSGEFRVRYIDDTSVSGSAGDVAPCDLFWNYEEASEYGYKIAGKQWNSVIRDVNVNFLLGN